MQVSEAESIVMDVLWREHPRTADDVVAALAEAQDWQEATIKTLLNRLPKKGSTAAEKDGRPPLYTPLLKREDWLIDESQRQLERLFAGRVAQRAAPCSEHPKPRH